MANSAADVIGIAAAEVGYSRWSDKEQGTKYGRWYAQQTGDGYYGTNGVPYCAMFVSWVMDRAGAKCEGIPGAYCPWILDAGRKAGKLVSASSAKPGDVVLYDWEGDGTSDHVGFVERNSGVLYTIEGNTNNGAVARRTRSYGTVAGIIRPDYDGSSAGAPPAAEGAGAIAVDGAWGKATTRAVQAALGTAQDGIVSDQYSGHRANNPGLTGGWEWHDKTTLGSDMVRALQRKVGAGVDGVAGPETFRALQAHLGTAQDGRIDNPSTCVIALQKRLNAGTF